jgi:hypothetical protein
MTSFTGFRDTTTCHLVRGISHGSAYELGI